MENIGAVKPDLTHLLCESTGLAHRGALAELNNPNSAQRSCEVDWRRDIGREVICCGD